jgi:hypothetical protein
MTTAPVFLSAVTNVASSGSQQAFIGNSSGIHELFSWNIGGAGHNAISCDGTGTNQSSSVVGTGGYFASAGVCNGASSYLAVGSSVGSGTTLGFISQTTLVVYGGQSGNAIQAGGIILEGQIQVGGTAPTQAQSQALTAARKSAYGWP